jgi:hypothetical protein
METRAVIEVKIYMLLLNHIMERVEQHAVVAISPSREELIKFYHSEKVEPYGEPGFNSMVAQDTTWRKTFRKDGPLEWYNPVDNIEGPGDTWGHGIYTEWFAIERIRLYEGTIVDPNKEFNTIQ